MCRRVTHLLTCVNEHVHDEHDLGQRILWSHFQPCGAKLTLLPGYDENSFAVRHKHVKTWRQSWLAGAGNSVLEVTEALDCLMVPELSVSQCASRIRSFVPRSPGISKESEQYAKQVEKAISFCEDDDAVFIPNLVRIPAQDHGQRSENAISFSEEDDSMFIPALV